MCLSQDINSAWKQLEAGEKEKQEFLMSELRRLKRLEHLAAKFEHKVGNIERWAEGREEKLSCNEDIESANLAEILVSKSYMSIFVCYYCLIVVL